MDDNVHEEISEDDLMAALKETKCYADISAEDLKKIYAIAFKHAKSRIIAKIRVQDVMNKEVVAIRKFEDIHNAAKILSDNNISGIPVVDRENSVIGMISEADVLSTLSSKREHTFKDIIRHLFGEPLPEKKMGDLVGDIMTTPAVIIGPNVDISEAAKLMDEKRIRRLPVVDDSNKLIGIISRRDIVRAIIRK